MEGTIKYGIKDMYTLENAVDGTGMIYLYLPKGSRTITLKVNGKIYSGTIETSETASVTVLEQSQ